MPTTQAPSVEQLKRAVEIAEQIEKLQAELAAVIGSQASQPAAATAAPVRAAAPVKAAAPASSGKRELSAEARQKIADAARRRWAKERAQKGSSGGTSSQKSASKSGGSKPRTMSPEARERIAEAARRRWAAHRQAAGK